MISVITNVVGAQRLAQRARNTWEWRIMSRVQGVGCGVAAFATLLGGAGTANAAEPAGAQVVSLEEIVVTAQKRTQVAQDVPISLYALSGDALESQGITSVQDLGNTLAGV